MAYHSRRQEKQVRLTAFDNEPMARLAEQRLRAVGIPSVTRCLRGGPGLWGSAYNLPHDLYVHESDEMLAREILELTPLELTERDAQASSQESNQNIWMVLASAMLVVLFLVVMISLFNRSS